MKAGRRIGDRLGGPGRGEELDVGPDVEVGGGLEVVEQARDQVGNRENERRRRTRAERGRIDEARQGARAGRDAVQQRHLGRRHDQAVEPDAGHGARGVLGGVILEEAQLVGGADDGHARGIGDAELRGAVDVAGGDAGGRVAGQDDLNPGACVDRGRHVWAHVIEAQLAVEDVEPRVGGGRLEVDHAPVAVGEVKPEEHDDRVVVAGNDPGGGREAQGVVQREGQDGAGAAVEGVVGEGVARGVVDQIRRRAAGAGQVELEEVVGAAAVGDREVGGDRLVTGHDQIIGGGVAGGVAAPADKAVSRVGGCAELDSLAQGVPRLHRDASDHPVGRVDGEAGMIVERIDGIGAFEELVEVVDAVAVGILGAVVGGNAGPVGQLPGVAQPVLVVVVGGGVAAVDGHDDGLGGGGGVGDQEEIHVSRVPRPGAVVEGVVGAGSAGPGGMVRARGGQAALVEVEIDGGGVGGVKVDAPALGGHVDPELPDAAGRDEVGDHAAVEGHGVGPVDGGRVGDAADGESGVVDGPDAEVIGVAGAQGRAVEVGGAGRVDNRVGAVVLGVGVPMAVVGGMGALARRHGVAHVEDDVAEVLGEVDGEIDRAVGWQKDLVIAPVASGEGLANDGQAVKGERGDHAHRDAQAVADVGVPRSQDGDVIDARGQLGFRAAVQRHPVAVFAADGGREAAVIAGAALAGGIVAEGGQMAGADVEVGIPADGVQPGAEDARVVRRHDHRVEVEFALLQVNALVQRERVPGGGDSRVAEEGPGRGQTQSGDGAADRRHVPRGPFERDGAAGNGVSGCALALDVNVPDARGQVVGHDDGLAQIPWRGAGIDAGVVGQCPGPDADARRALRGVEAELPAQYRPLKELGGNDDAVIVVLEVGQGVGGKVEEVGFGQGGVKGQVVNGHLAHVEGVGGIVGRVSLKVQGVEAGGQVGQGDEPVGVPLVAFAAVASL